MASPRDNEAGSNPPTPRPKPESLRAHPATPILQLSEDKDTSSPLASTPMIFPVTPTDVLGRTFSNASDLSNSARSLARFDADLSFTEDDVPRLSKAETDSRPSTPEHPLVVTEPATRAGSPQLTQANEKEIDCDNELAISTDEGVNSDSSQLHSAEHLMTMPSSQAGSVQLNSAKNEEADLDNEGNPSTWYKTPVLYKIACHEKTQSGDKRVNRYSDKPFEGLREAEGRLGVSVMDVCVDSNGMFDTLPTEKNRRRNQTRELFGKPNFEDDDKPFKLGSDFIIVSSTPNSVRIMSKAVINFIKQNLPYYPKALKSEELILGEPYKELAFTYDRFTEAIENPETAQVPDGMDQTSAETSIGKKFVWELNVVRDWFKDNYYEKEIAPERAFQDKSSVTYDKLWLLFQPGTYVFMGEGDRTQFYIVQSVSSPNSSPTSPIRPRSSIELWSLDFKGDRLTRRARQEPIIITEYSGQKEIVKLPIIPLKYMKGSTQDFVTRGSRHRQLFREACDKPQLKQYHGALGGGRQLQYSGAVVLDPLVCAERAGKPPGLGAVADLATPNQPEQFKEPKDNDGGLEYSMLNDISPSETGPFEKRENLNLLLTGRIWGFALGKNQCAQFDVMSFTSPTALGEKESAFDNLAMVETDLELIKALAMPGEVDVGNGESVSFEQTDFVNGKGLGKVILLHGPPGVGKSLTVECLARHMGRPLLSLKMTDIGTDQSAEQKLSVWLDFAQRWNAIVLLDEADTFLEQRNIHDLERNALVAAFLHVLEYFPGLIFWTSNLPAWLDDAVISRFHLCIEYPLLTRNLRDAIWLKFVTKSRREEDLRRNARVDGATCPRLEIDNDVLTYVNTDKVVEKLKLNGRDIRNAYHAAVRIAIHRARREKVDGGLKVVTVGSDDVRKVMEKKKKFHRYLQRANNGSEELRACKRLGRAPIEKSEDGSSDGSE